MSWHSQGTVAVTNGSTAVVGTGTGWFGALQNGWGFVGPDGRIYEIETVTDATNLVLKTAYQGAGAGVQSYAAFPTAGTDVGLVQSLQSLISNYQSIYDGPGQGKFSDKVVFQGDEDTGLERVGSNEIALLAGNVRQLSMKGGVASGAAVQSSATDATVGKLLMVGAFGLGAQTPDFIADLDNHDTKMGFYGVQTSTLGTRHADASSYGFLLVQRQSVTGISQTYTNSNGQGVFYRTATSGAWNAWKRLDPERGSNANGDYVRFADGTQICTNQAFQTSASDDVVWTYPATFLYPVSPGRPAVSGAVSATFGSDAFLGIGGIAGSGGIASQVSVRAIELGGSRVALSASLIAIGRWF